MEEEKAIIRFEDHGNGHMTSEVRGNLGDLLNLLLTGIEKTFEDEIERAMFKCGIKKVYKRWEKDESEEDDE